jgi:hypothetical protein
MNINNEAAEAMAKVLVEDGAYGVPWEDASGDDRTEAMGKARRYIEAAAPHMLEDAKADAWDEGASDGQWNTEHIYQIDAGSRHAIPNPYRSQA